MKKFFTKTFNSKPMTVCGVLFILVAPTRLANADPLQEARVSQVIQDVRLLEAHAAAHPAAVNDKVIKGSAVRTGVESRAELTFKDLTITRLGANTIFSFTAGAREAELTHGTILLQVPPNAPAVRANTTSVTVSVMGGTALLAAGPPTKFMVLEGTGTIYPLGHPEKAVTVHGGEMVLAEHGRTSKPEKFDVKLVLATSPLVTDFAPLANLPLIQTVMNDQVTQQQVAVTTSQPLIRDLINIVNVTSQSADTNPAVVQVRVGTPTPPPTPTPSITPPPTPTPSTTPPPTPSKFGTPTTITSPNPYVITSGTTITTDPSITTNGVTDFGKIYRGSTDDGPFTLWAFGSTSAFDTALNLDTQFFDPNFDPNHLPLAVFKFQSLSLTGDPTIDLSNNGVTKLALIGVDGITSGPPGGTLTFTGLDFLVLATVNGSINLTSDVSLQNLSELAMYARGAGSNLILNSPISNIGILELAAEGSLQLTNPGTMSVGQFESTVGNNLALQIGGSLLLDGKVNLDTLVLPGTTVAIGVNLTLNIGNDLTNSSTTEFSQLRVRNEGAHIGTGGNITVSVGGDLTTSGPTGGSPSDFDLEIKNTNGLIDNGGNILLTAGGSISTHGQLSLLVENYDFSSNPAGHIGTGGSIAVATTGNLTSDSISAVINNRNGGTIGSGVGLTLIAGGALTTVENGTDYFGDSSSLSLTISNRYDTFGSTIGGDATLALHADSASIGGLLGVLLSNHGGTIDGNALVNFNITHGINVSGADIPNVADAAEIELLNNSGPVGGVDSPLGGTIHGDATLQINTGNLTLTAGSFDVLLLNANNAMTGGTIDGSAIVDVSASAISVAQNFDAEIQNQRGIDATGANGGSIGGNATLGIAASSLSVGSELDADIVNFNNATSSGSGGSIGGNAAINVNITNALSSGGAANFQISNQSNVAGSPGGSIAGDATINVSAASISTNSLLAQINNNGGTIAGTANDALNVANNLTAPGGVTLQILNNGGHIVTGSAGDGVFYLVGGTTSTTSLLLNVDCSGGGFIDSGGNVTLLTVGPVMMDGGFDLEADNFNGGTINNGANVLAHFVGDVTATAGSGHSFNFNMVNGSGFSFQANGGTIGTGGNLIITFDGNAETTGTTTTGGFGANIYNGLGSITTGGNNLVTVGGNLACGNSLSVAIDNTRGHIGTGGNITLDVTGDIIQVGSSGTNLNLLNEGGTIGSSVVDDISAHNFSNAGDLFAVIDNSNAGMIGGDAGINFNITGDLTTSGNVTFNLSNAGGMIAGAATVSVATASISANSLVAQIDNTGGSIGANTEGGATINMNVSGTAATATDTTVAIYGSDGATFAAININGGTYNAGGTFLSYIDGDGTITFTNATAHADVLKAGVFGANGVVNIGGGMLSGDTELKLYAPGSNGQLNFVSNVTLGGNTAAILAANSVTIFNNVVVTIASQSPAEVYTTNANYTGFGGNGTTTGTFAGAGANNPQPLASAPPFNPATPSHHTSGGGIPRPPHFNGSSQINVNNTAELLALLDGATVGPDGKVRIPGSKSTVNPKDLSRMDANRLLRADRRMLFQQTRDHDITHAGSRRL